MKFFVSYIKSKAVTVFIFLLFSVFFFVSFYLYGLPLSAVFYPFLLCLLFGIVFLSVDCVFSYRKCEKLNRAAKLPSKAAEALPKPDTPEEKEYSELVKTVVDDCNRIKNEEETRRDDMVNYYTLWAHQIKTPISSMNLTLQNSDGEIFRKLSLDLAKTENYVDMVMAYLRSDGASDYVIQEYNIDEIIKGAVKKFAGEFIERKIKLEYTPVNLTVVTDKKWLSFVFEQIISNALKYTPSGSVKIYGKESSVIFEDTGTGISAEDLPRIFERGYTGLNGRENRRSSGLGLYLCGRICKNLGHSISAESEVGKGTKILVKFEDITKR